MALYAISDLHLSSDNKKSMEVFGDKWSDYMNRIKTNWLSSICDNDTVIIPGDISWATYLDQAVEDFKFLDSLPGNKVIVKGNHDYWWTTLNKLQDFTKQNALNNFYFLNNNSFIFEDTLICGSRGWICPEQEGYSKEDDKIFKRELLRLKNSLNWGMGKSFKKIVTAVHFPPFSKYGILNKEIEDIFKEYKIDICIYGHLHGVTQEEIFEGIQNDIEYRMVSADYLNFTPLKLISQ